MPENIKETILRYRAKNNLTQKQFADLVGISEKTISRAEKGEGLRGSIKMKILMTIEEGTK